MPETLEASQYDLPTGASLDIVHLDFATDAQSALRDNIEKGEQLQKEWRARFDRIYDEALRQGWDAPFLMRQVSFLLEKQRAALERLHPVIAELQQSVVAHRGGLDAEILELLRIAADLAFGWITPYQGLSEKLLALASARRFVDGEILRARPVEGEIDYGELSREHVIRYPKIRAALAK